MNDKLYDIVASDGRLLNRTPLGYRDARLFKWDADIDSEDTSSVIPSTRNVERKTHFDRLLVVIAVAMFAALAWRLLS